MFYHAVPVFKTGVRPRRRSHPFGQGDWGRTSDLLGPSQARYQLRYTLMGNKMAEREGFEPSSDNRATGLANQRHRPLGHRSAGLAATRWLAGRRWGG